MLRLDLIRRLAKLKLRLMLKAMLARMPKRMQEYLLMHLLENMEYLHQAVPWREQALVLKQEDLQALGLRLGLTVVTCDRAWAQLPLDLEILLLR